MIIYTQTGWRVHKRFRFRWPNGKSWNSNNGRRNYNCWNYYTYTFICEAYNIYIQLMLIATVWLGTIGFIDDYIKVFKKNKKGLAGKFKIIGQIGVGIIVGASMYWSDAVTIKSKNYNINKTIIEHQNVDNKRAYFWEETKSLKTTIPFVKNNELDYTWLISWINPELKKYSWLVFYSNNSSYSYISIKRS